MRTRKWNGLAIYLLMLFGIAVLFLTAGAGAGTTATVSQAAGTAIANSHDVPVTAEMLARAILILVLFGVIATLIATRRLPALIALPLMALGIGLLAGIPLLGKDGVLATIIEGRTSPSPEGSFLLYKAITYVILGGMFARFVSDARIAERIVKYAAEFGGEDPFRMSLLMALITIVIFTAIGGLPAIIMLGTVMFPILMSLGVPAVVCGCILVLAFPIGTSLSPSQWPIKASMYKIDDVGTVVQFFLIWALIQVIVLLVFLSVEFLRLKRTTVTPGRVFRDLLLVVVMASVAGGILFADKLAASQGAPESVITTIVGYKQALWIGFRWFCAAVLAFGLVHTFYQYFFVGRVTSQWNMLTPLLPLVFILVLGFGEAYGPAFLAALGYGFLTTPRERAVQRLSKAMMTGVADVAAPVVLMLGIGMLVAAARHPTTDQLLTPILDDCIPRNAMSYVLFFFLASPLSLYRGPLNEWGLGVGIARILQNFLPAGATMGAIQSVTMLQDPTTTQNVWICGYLKLDINALLFKLFFYSLSLVLLGLLLSAYMFF
jgi:hypothetical protein